MSIALLDNRFRPAVISGDDLLGGTVIPVRHILAHSRFCQAIFQNGSVRKGEWGVQMAHLLIFIETTGIPNNSN